MALDEASGTIYIADVSNFAIRSVKGFISETKSPTSQPSGQPSRQPTMQPSSQPTFHANNIAGNTFGIMSRVAGMHKIQGEFSISTTLFIFISSLLYIL